MPSPDKSGLTPSAFAHIDEEDRIDLLFEYLDDLQGRLEWVDDELAAHGFCALCIMANGARFAHECREVRQA